MKELNPQTWLHVWSMDTQISKTGAKATYSDFGAWQGVIGKKPKQVSSEMSFDLERNCGSTRTIVFVAGHVQ